MPINAHGVINILMKTSGVINIMINTYGVINMLINTHPCTRTCQHSALIAEGLPPQVG